MRNWPVPTNADETRTFLGFTGYYRSFVQNYAKIAKPLNDVALLVAGKRKSRRKSKQESPIEFIWGDEQQKAFETLKVRLTSPPILTYPNYSMPFILHTDASMIGLGAVLYQMGDDNKQQMLLLMLPEDSQRPRETTQFINWSSSV